MILFSPVSKLLGVLGNLSSRKHEFEADAYAADADRQREAVIERSRQATRAREKAIFEQQAQKSAEFRSMGLLGRLGASPVSERAAAQARAQWGITE